MSLTLNASNGSFRYIGLIVIAMYVNFTFVFKGFELAQYLIYYAFMFMYILYHFPLISDWFKTIKREYYGFPLSILCWIWIFIASLAVPFLYGTYDFSYVNVVLGVLRQCISQLFILILVYKYMNKSNLFENYINVMTLSGVLYILFSCLMLISSTFRSFWLGIIADSYGSESFETTYGYYTRYGLAGFSGFNVTIVCTELVLLRLLLLWKKIVEKRKLGIVDYSALFFLILGNSFYGRSGLLISLGMIVFFIFMNAISTKSFKLIYWIFIILGLSFMVITVLKEYNEQINVYYTWALGPVINFFETGHFNSTSSDRMFDMYFIPSFETILMGDGHYVGFNGIGYYMSTDIGLMRPMLFYGIFNQFIGYLLVFIYILGTRRKISKLAKGLGTLYVMLSIMSLIAFEIKGEAFFRLAGIYLVMLIIAFYESRRITFIERLEKDG